jgi:MFS transporter, FSR family, fosmidomycin resistance protein
MARESLGIRDWAVTGLVSYPHAFSHIYFLVLPPLFPLLKAEFGVSYAALGLLMTAFGVVAGIGQTPIGFVVDRIGARPVLIGGILLQAGSVAAMGFAHAYWQLLALYTLAGVGHTVYHPADFAILAAQVSKSRLGRAIGIHSFGGNLAWALTPLFMIGVTSLWNWRVAMVAIGALGLAIVPVILWRRDLVAGGADLDRSARAAPGASAKKPERPTTREGLAFLLSAPIMMCFAFYVLQGVGFGGLRTFFVAAAGAAHDVPLTVANSALSAMMLGSAIGILFGGWLADRVGARLSIVIASLGIAGALVVLAGEVAMPAALLIGTMSVTGFTQGMYNPIRDLTVRSVTPDGDLGKVMGFVSSGMNLAGGIMPLVFGWVMDQGEPRLIFWLVALFVIAAMFTFSGVKGRLAATASRAAASA